MIDLSKEYKTIDGNAVKLFEIHKDKVIGMVIFQVTSPYPTMWELDGKHFSIWKEFDLVEVKPIIEHSAWINVYKWGIAYRTYNTKEDADICAEEHRIDCIEIKYSNK